jgi:hypothetical protein
MKGRPERAKSNLQFNQVCLHSALDCLTAEEFTTGYADLESKSRFLNSNRLEGGCQTNSSPKLTAEHPDLGGLTRGDRLITVA